jgi:hypothetical protein
MAGIRGATICLHTGLGNERPRKPDGPYGVLTFFYLKFDFYLQFNSQAFDSFIG